MRDNPVVIGWREWLVLPDLGISAIKAKIDTGAKTSALHAFHVERFAKDNKDYVRFKMHPIQNNTDTVVECSALLIDEREVRDSGGHREMRYVIKTKCVMCEHEWPIEVTLTNRDDMKFRMLLGRSAMKGDFLVNPAASFCCGNLDDIKHNNTEI